MACHLFLVDHTCQLQTFCFVIYPPCLILSCCVSSVRSAQLYCCLPDCFSVLLSLFAGVCACLSLSVYCSLSTCVLNSTWLLSSHFEFLFSVLCPPRHLVTGRLPCLMFTAVQYLLVTYLSNLSKPSLLGPFPQNTFCYFWLITKANREVKQPSTTATS